MASGGEFPGGKEGNIKKCKGVVRRNESKIFTTAVAG